MSQGELVAFRRLKRMAKRGQVMIANKDGFTLVEDLEEYIYEQGLKDTRALTTKEILAEALDQLEMAFDRAEAENGIHPRS